ncbi:hypothetical protein [Psychroserpens sp. SPM9]|uniref:hypothetical protein n=1 Tax=Psychroserpens sp. SPM9 TaxID=2975598 RepID=UPI0021A955E0|nr:hypothetical protein [Psychroserpens sp. SPM9]MDG5493271.1 hypothetical protein [Psychroserpens sp. SPM9]
MKNLLFILILVFSHTMTSQTSESEKIFWDLIDYKLYPEKFSDVGYLKKVDFGMLSYHLANFEKDSILTYYQYKNKKTDSITLTKNEKEFLISELKSSENYTWNLANAKKLILVEENSELEFLKADKNRELKIISKPIFIRNGKVTCVFSVHLCCGHIYGYVSLSLYKKINGKWERWIPLSEGNF